MSDTVWTAERLKQLKALRESGYTYSQIGSAMGVSRNAAIGAGKRHDVVKPCAVRPKGGRPSSGNVASKPKPPYVPKPPVVQPDALHTPLEHIGFGRCRFPLWGNEGGAPNFECCGLKGFPWCDYHREVIKGKRVA